MFTEATIREVARKGKKATTYRSEAWLCSWPTCGCNLDAESVGPDADRKNKKIESGKKGGEWKERGHAKDFLRSIFVRDTTLFFFWSSSYRGFSLGSLFQHSIFLLDVHHVIAVLQEEILAKTRKRQSWCVITAILWAVRLLWVQRRIYKN